MFFLENNSFNQELWKNVLKPEIAIERCPATFSIVSSIELKKSSNLQVNGVKNQVVIGRNIDD